MARAESFESMAVYGRRFTLLVRVGADVDKARAAKGPCGAEASWGFGPRSTGRHRGFGEGEPWLGERPLRITLAPDLAIRGEEELVARLQAVARLAPVEVFSSPSLSVLSESVRQLEWSRTDPDQLADGVQTWRVTASGSSTVHGTMTDGALIASVAAELRNLEGLDPLIADELALCVSVHEQIGNDLLVTESPNLLGRRFGNGWGSRCGLVSSREAVSLVEAHLRLQQQFVAHIDDRTQFIGDRVGFYNQVAMAHLPTATTAHASCLAPSRRQAYRSVAGHVESLIARYHDLLVAADHLTRLAQIERHVGGGNDLLAQQTYHLQNSLVLYTGSLDMLAWVCVALEGRQVERRKVSWEALSHGSWAMQLMNPDAKALRDAARRLAQDPVAKVARELRDSYQHRHPVRGCSAHFVDDNGLVRAAYGVIDMSASVDPQVLASVTGDLGFVDAGAQVVVPHKFQRKLLASLQQLAEGVLGASSWPSADWYLSDPKWRRSFEERRWMRERYAGLFGPLE